MPDVGVTKRQMPVAACLDGRDESARSVAGSMRKSAFTVFTRQPRVNQIPKDFDPFFRGYWARPRTLGRPLWTLKSGVVHAFEERFVPIARTCTNGSLAFTQRTHTTRRNS